MKISRRGRRQPAAYSYHSSPWVRDLLAPPTRRARAKAWIGNRFEPIARVAKRTWHWPVALIYTLVFGLIGYASSTMPPNPYYSDTTNLVLHVIGTLLFVLILVLIPAMAVMRERELRDREERRSAA